jgi:hypothetical protein
MRGWALAAVAGILISAEAAALAPGREPATDAPSVTDATAFMAQVIERSHLWQASSMVGATTTTTPEAAHRLTGARCRFWYRHGDITYPFYNDNHVECLTSWDWLYVSTKIDRRETPMQVAGNPNHIWSYLIHPDVPVGDIAATIVGRTARAEHGTFEVSQPQRWTGRDGATVDYVVAHVRFRGGGPDGTREERISRVAVAVIGDWIFTQTSDGPVYYTGSIDQIGEDGFAKLLQSIDEAGLIL